MKTYILRFSRWSTTDGGELKDERGYNAWDYLPGSKPYKFSTREAARKWLVENHRGADESGVVAEFEILEEDS